MIYNGRLTPPNNWPPLVRYPPYYPDRRLSTLWFLVLTIVSLSLSVIALIIVFAVESAWFRDNFNSNSNRYGLWRLCFTNNNTCDSWFAPSGTNSDYIDRRLNYSRSGINAWQALEIVFLFLTTSTLIITIASLVCYRFRSSFHYYLALLAAFCIWLAVCIGVSSLFVFGFSVYNVAPTPRDLDWCFYVNLVAVILVVLAAILLTIYDILLRKPIKTVEDDTVIETFADVNGYPATLSPSTFVIVRRNKKKRSKPYDYPQILYPNTYLPTTANGVISNTTTTTEYASNPNPPSRTPVTSVTTTRETNTTTQQQPTTHLSLAPYQSIDTNRSNVPLATSTSIANPPLPAPISTQPFESSYTYQQRYSPLSWPRAGTNTIDRSVGYISEPTHDYIQRDYYYPPRSNTTERRFEQKNEPRLLHYYTGYDYFATLDPSDLATTRHHPSTTIHHPSTTILGPPLRYSGSSSYYPQSDYIKSTL